MKKNELLKKALEFNRAGRRVGPITKNDDEYSEMGIAWLSGQISITDVVRATKGADAKVQTYGASLVYQMMTSLRRKVVEGSVTIN